MTIKELEEKTGMTRANIRFYEGEGLLAPKRLDNGYRDYSEEDARTLEKIKLLRQLQLDLDTIRRVQQGTLTLDQALFVQQTKLEGDRVLIERASEVCRELGESGVEYGALDPRPYLARLDAPNSRPVLPNPPPPTPKEEAAMDTAPKACYHPWMRWLARTLDMMLYQTVFHVLWLVLTRNRSLIGLWAVGGIPGLILAWLLGLVWLAFTLAVEPLWLHFWGWTPGKWVFGLKLRDKDGKKLPIAWGIDRSKTLAWEGYGWNIPIYSLWVFWRNRKDALDGWNGSWNGEHACRYIKEERRFSGWVFAGMYALCFAALFLGLRYTELPVNRGELTVAEFAQNYNHYIRLLMDGVDEDFCPRMDETGLWVERESNDGSYSGAGGYATVTSSETFNGVPVRGETVWQQPEFTVENDRVTAVTLRWVSDHTYIFSDGSRETLALLALSGSAEGTGLFSYDLSGWVKATDGLFTRWGDQDETYRGLHIVQVLDYSGYEDDGIFLIATEGKEQHCEKTVTISLTE